MKAMNKGNLYILSGPSGSGKDTLINALRVKHKEVRLSISSITRNMREGEIEGEKYHFIKRKEFESLIENDMLLEFNEYCGNYYGTPKQYVVESINDGYDVLLEIDVNGADIVRSKMPEAISVFIMPPSFEILKKRLSKRGTETEDVINERLKVAVGEIRQATKYDYIVVNDDIDAAVNDFWAIMVAQRNRLNNKKYLIDEVLEKC